jgi:Fe-S-cluster containining protein
MSNNLDEEQCARCGGQCCKHMPGATMPEDWPGDKIQALKTAFESGKWVIDWWMGDPRPGCYELRRAYYVRPRATSDPHGLYCPTYGGRCVFLQDNGCELWPEERPAECRMLTPHPVSCDPAGVTKHECAIAWIPYNGDIVAAAGYEQCAEDMEDDEVDAAIDALVEMCFRFVGGEG